MAPRAASVTPRSPLSTSRLRPSHPCPPRATGVDGGRGSRRPACTRASTGTGSNPGPYSVLDLTPESETDRRQTRKVDGEKGRVGTAGVCTGGRTSLGKPPKDGGDCAFGGRTTRPGTGLDTTRKGV